MEKNNRFIAWAYAESLDQAEKEISTTAWKCARDIEPTKLTKSEIAEKLGLDIDSFEIV